MDLLVLNSIQQIVLDLSAIRVGNTMVKAKIINLPVHKMMRRKNIKILFFYIENWTVVTICVHFTPPFHG